MPENLEDSSLLLLIDFHIEQSLEYSQNYFSLTSSKQSKSCEVKVTVWWWFSIRTETVTVSKNSSLDMIK